VRRLILSLTVVLFLIWILPLGYFIKPSQEKIACDGQRGICMCCCHIFKKVSPGKVMLSCSTQGTSKEASSSGGASNYFLSTVFVTPVFDLRSSQWGSPIQFPSLFFIRSIESVPKF